MRIKVFFTIVHDIKIILFLVLFVFVLFKYTELYMGKAIGHNLNKGEIGCR